MQKQSFWSGVVVVMFALLALNWIIPVYAGASTMAGMPPDLLPRLAAWLMLVSATCVVANAAFNMLRSGERLISSDIDWPAVLWAAWPFFYVAAAIYVLTIFKITHAGAPIIAGMLFLLGERRWYMLLGCSVAPVVLLYMLSVHLMRVGVI